MGLFGVLLHISNNFTRFFMMKSISCIGSMFLLTSSLAIATTSDPAAARSNSDQLSALQSPVVQPGLLAGRSGPLRSAQAVPKKKILGIFGQPTPTPSASSSPGVTKAGAASPTPSPTTTSTASPTAAATPTPAASSSPGVTRAGTASPAAVVKPLKKTVKKRNIRGMFGQPALKKTAVTKAGAAIPTPAPTEKKVLGTFSPATPQPAASPKTSGQKLLGIFNR
jgi:hypothetical protein